MNAFRQVLDEYLERRRAFAAVEQELDLSLAQQPQLAAAHGAYVEALFRGGRVGGEDYLALVQRIRTFQQSRAPAAAPEPAAALAPDKTQLRRLPQAPLLSGDPGHDETRFRPLPRAPTPSANAPAGHPAAQYEPGATEVIIKGRFVLEGEIGRSRTGVVFKARDLRKQEAQDRKPHVALKRLDDGLRQDSHALDVWQREALAAQHLAHPNILAVYNFYRDDSIAFLVMELLEGELLEPILRRRAGKGIASKEALRVSRDICSAMSYAHAQGIVHGDFKPTDVCLTHEGGVKVLGFSLARAKRAIGDAAAPTTPAIALPDAAARPYASCEVMEGKEPEPRDDVYSVACLTYEMLSGKHPYAGRTAIEARDANMTPEPPPGLPRTRWRALQRGLAFSREQRPAAVLEFMNALHPPKRSVTLYIGAALAAALAVLIVTIVISGQVARNREQSVIATLATGSAQQIEALLPALRSMQPAQRNIVLAHDDAREGLIHYFATAIDVATGSTGGNLDLQRARALASELGGFFPDSLAVKGIVDRVAHVEPQASQQQVSELTQTAASPTTTAPPVPPTSLPAQALPTAPPTPAPRVSQALPPGTCSAALVGQGQRQQGVCFDSLDGRHGPELVVVPTPAGAAKIAIGRTQVSNSDYALYCTRSAHCKTPPGLPGYPLTFISFAEAQGYLEWLSQTSGARYRLPTDSEWQYAVEASYLKRAKAAADCVVELDPNPGKTAIVHATLSGRPNNWGIYNFSGSAAEWVGGESEIGVRGGAYTGKDPRCRAAPQSGAPDAMIGFRVVRELN
jgi:hypothetical protein